MILLSSTGISNRFKKKHLFYLTIIFLMSTSANVRAQQWNRVTSGVWKTKIGDTSGISLLKVAGVKPKMDAISKLSSQEFPLDSSKVHMEKTPNGIYLRIPLKKQEELYGLGLNFKTHNQRGRILNLHVDHYGQSDNGRTHAPVPFVVSSEGYGILLDAAKYISVYAGTGVRKEADDKPILRDRNTDPNWEVQPYSDGLEIFIPGQDASVYLFAGKSMLEVVQRYNLFNGGGYLPPKWGLGFTQRVPTLYSSEDILNEVEEFREHDFPLDFIGVEPGWQTMAYPCTYEWDKKRFPDPKGFMEQLQDKGIRANLWLNPYVSPAGKLYSKIEPYSGSHTVWNGIVPDYTLDRPKEILKEHFLQNHLDIGVSGYKIDEVDGYDRWLWPDIATFPSGTSAEEMRQVYGLLVQKMTSDWFMEKNQRTYGLVRASNAGASSFPYVLYNDYYSHKDFITALINSSFIGVLWTPEVRSSASSEEWLRRMQSVCFSPMAMLNAWADGTKPWSFEDVEDSVREVAQLRMRLLPYIYTAFAQYQHQGIPPFRAMQLEEGFQYGIQKEEGVLDSKDNPYNDSTFTETLYQYMMGEDILVAPMFVGEQKRNVILPKGKWYDFYTGEFVGENETIVVEPGLDKIPLFVKDGGIIPMLADRRNQMPLEGEILPLEVRHYGTVPSKRTLYDDNGVTFDHMGGEYSWTELAVKKTGHTLKGSLKTIKKGIFNYRKKVDWVFMTKMDKQ